MINNFLFIVGIIAMEALHQKVLPFILRRMKGDVLKDLPPKITQVCLIFQNCNFRNHELGKTVFWLKREKVVIFGSQKKQPKKKTESN